MSFIAELRRRNVFRVGAAYVIAAWLLIQVAETIFPLFGFDETPARIVVIVLAIGFIPTLVFTWVFELTPEGLKREAEVDRNKSITAQTSKKLDRVIMVVLTLALAYFAFDNFVLDPQREAAHQERVAEQVEQAHQAGRTEALIESYGDQSIAVLAFDDMSPKGDQEYLSDGIAEELLNLLAKIPELRVISRSSSFSFKGQNLEIPEIAERLNVTHILEGSVRKAGNRIRVTAQLIEARSDTHVWSETYDRNLDDVFAIQDDIAVKVVGQLKVELLGQVPRVEETDPEAYALYLQAGHLAQQLTPESTEQSYSLYRQALAIDPEYAPAWLGLAGNYFGQVMSGTLRIKEGFDLARESAEEALAIDPDYASAHAFLGNIAEDRASAIRHYERALQLDPADLKAIDGAASMLQCLGRLDAGIALSEYVVARNPVSVGAHNNLGVAYLTAEHWDEAIASFEAALRLSPNYIFGRYGIGRALLFSGEAQAALEQFRQAEDHDYCMKGEVLALHALGRQHEHEKKLQELIERWGGTHLYDMAHVYAYLGETDLAFEWLDRALQENTPFFYCESVDPYYTPIHGDPRWAVFLKRVGSSPAQLDAIEFTVKLPQ